MTNTMRNQTLQEIKNDLDNMEITGKVDLDVLNKLEVLRILLHDIQNKWLENDNNDSFYFYQASRNVELILNKMIYRFEHSQEKNDNPQIAKDTLVLLPAITAVLDAAENDEISEPAINKILHRTMHLRDIAATTNLMEDPEDDKLSLDKHELQSTFDLMMKSLDMPTSSKKQIGESCKL